MSDRFETLTKDKARYNKELTKNAINRILNKDVSKIVGWDIPQEKVTFNYDDIDMTILKQIYMEKGLKGLSEIEILCPAYITENGDIFGIPDVSNYGKKNDNDKLIIVQRFNIYDQIMDRNKSAFVANYKRIDNIEQITNYSITLDTIYTVSSIISLIIMFAIIIISHNNYVKKEVD
jgi:hypothetical protein